jgi:hypothetical protein
MHEDTDQPAWAQLKSQTRTEKLTQGRFAYLSISRSPRIVLCHESTVQVQHIPAFRGGSCPCMYYCTVSDSSVCNGLGLGVDPTFSMCEERQGADWGARNVLRLEIIDFLVAGPHLQ